MALRYVTVNSVRVASGVNSSFIDDTDMQELLEYMEEEVERYLNVRFTPYTVIEQYEGTDSERLILKNNPLLKIRALDVDGTTIDIDDVRFDKQPGVVWLTTSADKSSFVSKTTERNLIRIKYDYGLLEETTTQTTNSNAETEGDSVVVEVGSTTGFSVNDYVEIHGFDSLREVAKITAIDSGVSLTLDNLATSHEASSLITLQRVPKVAERIMIVACAMAAVARVVGQSYDEITGYSIGEMSINRGEPYTQWREVTTQLRKEWNDLKLAFRTRPAIS